MMLTAFSYGRMAAIQAQLAGVLLKDPDVASISSYVGVDGTNNTLNAGRMLINMVPRGQSSGSQDKILEDLRERAENMRSATRDRASTNAGRENRTS